MKDQSFFVIRSAIRKGRFQIHECDIGGCQLRRNLAKRKCRIFVRQYFPPHPAGKHDVTGKQETHRFQVQSRRFGRCLRRPRARTKEQRNDAANY